MVLLCTDSYSSLWKRTFETEVLLLFQVVRRYHGERGVRTNVPALVEQQSVRIGQPALLPFVEILLRSVDVPL